MRVLVVEDEKRIASFIKRGLEEEAYSVDVAYDGEEGLMWINNFSYDIIILDILMPKMDGTTLCRSIRGKNIGTPVLMLTAKDTIDEKVEGLDAGADDYLVKPFAFKELLARIRALTRRRPEIKGTTLIVADLELDLITHRTFRNGKEIELTNREYALLELLMSHAGQVLSRTIIAEHIWDFNFFNQSNIVDVFIRQLRKKIDEPFVQKLIHTVRGAGYKIQGGSKP